MEKRVEGCKRKYVGKEISSKLKRILGGKVRDKTFGKYGKLKEMQVEKEIRRCEARHRQK